MKRMKKTQKKGFTLIELSFALIFISIILITIAWLTIHITTTYQKGLAMKAVNASAKEIIDDFSRAISTSPAQPVESICAEKYTYSTDSTTAYQKCVKDNARKFMYQQRYGQIKIRTKEHPEGEVKKLPTNGVFCSGRYSYIWNTAYVLNTEDYKPAVSIANYKATFNYAKDPNFRLLKVSDFDKELCKQHMVSGYMYDDRPEYKLGSDPEVKIDLLDSSENNLAIYDLAMFSPTVHTVTSSALHSGTFILATLRGGVDVTATGEFCTDPPDNLDTDFAYCSINKFNFTMRAAGEKTLYERWK